MCFAKAVLGYTCGVVRVSIQQSDRETAHLMCQRTVANTLGIAGFELTYDVDYLGFAVGCNDAGSILLKRRLHKVGSGYTCGNKLQVVAVSFRK